MYGLAYVILPKQFEDLQSALDCSLAAFQRGGEDLFPRQLLSFEDLTTELAALHRSRIKIANGRIELSDLTGVDGFLLSFSALLGHLTSCGVTVFDGPLIELEPDFDAFVAKYCRHVSKDLETGRVGRWLNPLGRWDWWELGGRFNGVITGQRRQASSNQKISSRQSSGRRLLDNLARVLGSEPATGPSEIELNVELASTLREHSVDEPKSGMPNAVVLPVELGSNRGRWFDSLQWHVIPSESRQLLDAGQAAGFAELVDRTYLRFSDRAVAGVAYHF
jgi:hypothetical protein